MPCCQNPVHFCTPGADNNVEFFLVTYNAFGTVSRIFHGQSVTTFVDPDAEFGI
jgi:hypothetical protein